MKTRTSKSYRPAPAVGSSSGTIILFLGIMVFIGLACYWAHDRILHIHRELFNAEAPVTYDVDFGNMTVIAKSRITSHRKKETNRWKEFPLMNQSLVYRITHNIGVGSHTGTIELKVSENPKTTEILNDIVVNFNATSNEVLMDVKPFEYAAPDFKLVFSEMAGSFSMNGHLRLKTKNLDLKMVNYNFRLTDVSLDVPSNRNAINILASKINFDEVSLGHSKIIFLGTIPFQVKLQSTYEKEPVEIHWNLEATKVKDLDVHVGSGKLHFPVGLLNAFVDPTINRQLLSQEQQASNSGSEKARFLFTAAKDVRRSEARALTLRAIAPSRHIKIEDNVYRIQIDKQDAFASAEDRAVKASERKALITAWRALVVEKMYEEAFNAVMLGDDNQFLAAKELLEALKEKGSASPLYQALQLRVDFRDAEIALDQYDQYKIDRVTERVESVTARIPDQRFETLLWLEYARAKNDKALEIKYATKFKDQEKDPLILAIVESSKHLHKDDNKAIEILTAARDKNPDEKYTKNISRELIHLYQHAGKKDKLEAELKLLLAIQRPSTEDLLLYAKLLEEKKDLALSLETLDKCIDVNPVHKGCLEHKEAVMTQIAYEKQKENTETAIGYLENLIVDRPASVPANSGLGFLYKLKGDEKKSITHYSIACALGNSFSCVEAGDTLARSSDSEKALLLYDISCDLKSGNGCSKAGLILEKNGQIENSGGFYDRSCNQLMDNVGCYHLARNLRAKNAPNRSIATYLTKACASVSSACKLAALYQKSNKQPEIPIEPN